MPDKSNWDKRADGSTKGTGFLGPKTRADGRVSTEISVGVDFGGNKNVEIPTMVPGLDASELNTLMTRKDTDPVPDSVVSKAVKHAKTRIRAGRSPFAGDDEINGKDMGELDRTWADTFKKQGY